MGRRAGLARGIYNRHIEDDRFPCRQIPPEVQWRLNSTIPAEGVSAYKMAFGSNPADFFGWDDNDGDLLFTQDTSLSGQLAQQWKLRMRAQESALKEVANSKLAGS